LNVTAINIDKNTLSDSKSADIYKANDDSIKNNNPEKMNIGNLEDNKSLIEAKPVNLKFTIKKLPNTKLKIDKKSKKQLGEYKKCEIKSGVVNFVILYDYKKNILTVKPVFYSVDQNSINFYESLDQTKSLFSTIKFLSISKLSTNFLGTNCLTFVQKLDNGYEKDSGTICLNNEKEKGEWIGIITEFKECGFKILESTDNVLFDYNKANILQKERKAKEEFIIKEELQKIGSISTDGLSIMPFGSKKYTPIATLKTDKTPAAVKVRAALKNSKIKLIGNKLIVRSYVNIGAVVIPRFGGKPRIYGGGVHGGAPNGAIVNRGIINGGIVNGATVRGGILRPDGIQGGIIQADSIHPGIVEDPLGKMYYDNSNKANRKPAIVAAKQALIKKELGKILTHIEEGKVAQQQVERKMRCKISKAEKVKKEVEKQKELVKTIVEERALKSRERNAILGQTISNNKEVQLMKAVGLRIKKLNQVQLKEKKAQLRTTLNAVKGLSDVKVNAQNELVVDTNKLSDYKSCVNVERLNSKYIFNFRF
jgi:hypothetical protein